MKINFVISFISLMPINIKQNIDHINSHTEIRPCIYEHCCQIFSVITIEGPMLSRQVHLGQMRRHKKKSQNYFSDNYDQSNII